VPIKSRGLRDYAIILALPGLVTTCAVAAPSEPLLPAGAVALIAPPVYLEWQLKTEKCSGLTGDYLAVEWYVVPGVSSFATDRGPQVGMWTMRHGTHRIILAGNYAGHEMVVRHEILHALIGRTGHPDEYFLTRCHLTWESWGPSIANSGR